MNITRLSAGAFALSLLAACGEGNVPGSTAAPALTSGIELSELDDSVRPGDDFFAYVNGKWVAATRMPADKARYGTFDMLRDEAEAEVRQIIEMSASGDFADGTDEQMIGDLYRSYMDLKTRNAVGVQPLQVELGRIEAIADYDDLAAYFAGANMRGYSMPFSTSQSADMKDPDRYGIYVFQDGLGLGDREYYLKDDNQSKRIREQYVAHIGKMFDLAGLPDGAGAADTVMALETRIAGQQMKKEDVRNPSANYNLVSIAGLSEVMPGFNWDRFLEAAHMTELDAMILYMTDYMRALDGIIADTDLATWKTYLTWSVLNGAASRLSEPLDAEDYAFYGQTLRGTEEQRELWRRGVTIVNGSLGELVGQVYVRDHFPPEAKERMLTLVGNLIDAYERSIRELDWMSDATRAQALEKLHRFTPKIGYPDEWREYDFDVAADDLFGNLERAAVAEYERELERQDGPVDRGEWGMTPQTVNAYYESTLNEIVFPAAILQPPFFDMTADDAVNYGAIGAVIGHEIGHGFDDQGSQFDGDGLLRNWWTDEDRAEFRQRTDALVSQYNAFKPFDDLNVNGEFTLGENIGDLGGITIGLLAYKISLGGEEAPVIDGLTGEQRVFLGYAQVWRSKVRDAELRRRIATDPHAPSVYRTNGAVRNVPEFYTAFGVEEGDALYLPPAKRVKIW